MLLPLAVLILACGAHAPVPQQDVAAQADCCKECKDKNQLAKKHLLPEDEIVILEESEETQDSSQEERHIVTFAEAEPSES
jgi:hypothetical protein